MYGKQVSLFKAPYTGFNNISTAFANKEKITDFFNFMIPEANPNDWNSHISGQTLVNNSGLVGSIASLFDTYVPNWQLSTSAFYTTDLYSWVSNYFTVLFPFNISEGGSYVYFLWDEVTNYFCAIIFDPSTSQKVSVIFRNSNFNSGGSNVNVNMLYAVPSIDYVMSQFTIYNSGRLYRAQSYAKNNITYGSMSATNYVTDAAVFGDFFTNAQSGYIPVTPPTDPYTGAGDSTTGGGGGTFDGSSDPVAVPALPSVGATDTGFISLFVPTQAQLKQVADYLWSGLFDLSTYLKIFENPMDCILGLSVVPVTVPTSGSANITVGNIELSGISLPLASQQYVEVDCGTIAFTDKYFGSYLDQDPYTKMALFVPYSGIHSVKADDIMGKTVGLKYHIDILTGSLVAFLTCGDSVLYEFNGACASNIPVNSINYASTIENAIRIAVNIGTTVATAGAAAPMTGAEAATREAARTFGTAVNMAGSTAEGILSLKPNIDRAGSLGGTTGLMGNQKPYFIITRPRLCKPANQNTFKGYPSFIQVAVSDLIGEGYTEFDTIILAGLYLTDAEKEELQQILKSGVYL